MAHSTNKHSNSGANNHSANIASLTSILTQYTAQIDEFHKLCTNVAVSLMTFAGVVLTACATIYGVVSKSEGNSDLLSALSLVVLLLPTVGTMILYVLSISMRKDAIYRAYCGKVEDRLKEITGDEIYHFHKEIVPKEMARFKSNTLGVVFLGIILVILYVVTGTLSFIWSGFFKEVIFARICIGLFLLVNVVFSGIFIRGIVGNTKAMERAVKLDYK